MKIKIQDFVFDIKHIQYFFHKDGYTHIYFSGLQYNLLIFDDQNKVFDEVSGLYEMFYNGEFIEIECKGSSTLRYHGG